MGYNKKSDIKIGKIKNFFNYKLLTIKSFNKEYKFKIKNQLIKNIAFGIAVLEILNLDLNKIKNRIKNIGVLEGEERYIKLNIKN